MGTPMDGAQAPKSSLAGLCVMCGSVPVGSSSLWGMFLSQTPSSVAVGVLSACPSQQLVPAHHGDRSHAVMGTRGKSDVPGAKGRYLNGPAPGDLRGGIQWGDTNVTFLLPALPPANPPGGSAPCLAPRPRSDVAAPSASPHTPPARCPETVVSTPSLPQPCLFLHRSLEVMPCQAPWGAARRAQPPACTRRGLDASPAPARSRRTPGPARSGAVPGAAPAPVSCFLLVCRLAQVLRSPAACGNGKAATEDRGGLLVYSDDKRQFWFPQSQGNKAVRL